MQTCVILALMGLALASPVWGQDGANDIVVTAQKRAQSIEDVPQSVGVLAGAELDAVRAGGQDILFLAARTPSLYAESSSGRTYPRFYIRGLGNTDFDLNANQPVGLVYDDVVLENAVLKGFPVFDLDRVEVLRGPQGTLFGRNTPAGVIKFESARPTRAPEGYGRISYGLFDTVDAEGAVSGPLGPTLSARLSGLYQRRDDFVNNVSPVGGEDGFEEYDDLAGRLQLLFEPRERLSVLLNVHGRRLDGGSRLFRANIIRPGRGGLVDGFERRRTAQDATQLLEVRTWGASLRVEAELGAAALTAVGAYERVRVDARGDVDGGFGAVFAPPSGPGPIPFPAESADNITGHDQWTQEVRAAFAPVAGLDITAGVFGFYERLDIENLSFDTLAGGVENGRALQRQRTTALAAFVSGTWATTPRLALSAGARLSYEEKEFRARRVLGPFGAPPLGPIERELDDVVPSWDASALYDVSDMIGVYARYARGFRAPNVQGRIVFGDAVTVAGTETIDSIEAGVKARSRDGRGRLSATGFYYRTDDQQLTAVGGAGNFNQLLNADAVEGYGFEVDASWRPTDRIAFTAGLSLNETAIDDPLLEVGTCGAPCTVRDLVDPFTRNARVDGNRLPNAPRVIASATLRYGVPMGGGELYTLVDVAHRSGIGFFLYDSVEFRDDQQTEVGARIAYRFAGDRFEAAVFGRNLTDDRSIEGAIDFNNFSGYVADPPTWGLELGARF